MTAAEASAGADLVVMLAADEDHGRIYAEEVAPNLRRGRRPRLRARAQHPLRPDRAAARPRRPPGRAQGAGHGAAGPNIERGSGLISLFAVHQDASGGAEALALSYAAAIGSGRVGILPTSFAEECEADLFNEQAVLWGAIPELIHAGFETLVEAGFSPEIAYFECLTEVKLIADLIYERGIAGMREAISNTAEFGALKGGSRIVTADTRTEMRRILREVRAGSFVKELIADAEAGYPRLTRLARPGGRASDRRNQTQDIGTQAIGERKWRKSFACSMPIRSTAIRPAIRATTCRSSSAIPTGRRCRRPRAIDFRPGALLGSVSGELGLSATGSRRTGIAWS